MIIWQISEYASVLPIVAKALWANRPNDSVRVVRKAFGPHPNQYVLLCYPGDSSVESNTFVFFAHGGGWRTGAPSYFRFIGYFFASLGFPTILAGYRLAPACKFPAQLEDVSAGLRMGIEMLRNEKILVRKVILGGQSSGAHLVSLLAYDPAKMAAQYLQQEAIALKGLLLVSAPLDFSQCKSRTIRKYISDFMGDTSNWDQANPIRYIRRKDSIPVLCIHGDKDPLVDVQSSLTFINSFMETQDGLAQIHIVRGGHHTDLTELFLRHNHPAVLPMIEWLEKRSQE